jgi:aldose 1-epimerase
MISLAAGDWEAEVRPQAGGSMAALRYRGVDVLSPMPEGTLDPLQAACFPLVPYCNRIASGRFEWAGEEVQLPPNFLPERHSLHGLSWQRPWSVESQVETKCVLVDDYDGKGAWPWAYRAQQRIRLGPRGCAMTLVLINRSDGPMPAGLGIHPYFRRGSEASIRFASDHVLLVSSETLPTGVTALPSHFGEFAGGDLLPTETVDHCFAYWQGAAEISDDLGTIRLTADGAPHLHLYAPADGSALCLEPVSHTPDALNQAPDEMIVLPPGCAAAMTLWISAS